MIKGSFYRLLLVLPIVAIAACADSENDATVVTPVESSGPVLAEVNGEAITQADVDYLIERTFSNSNQLVFDEQMQSKVLDSLIASKAMKQQMEKELSADEITMIQQKINAYGEELFVKEYLVKNATPEPVSTQMVQDYYQSHLEEFGGGESRVFEMLKTPSRPSEQQRDQILENIIKIKDSVDWSNFSASNTDQLGLTYYRSTMQPGLLESALENAVKSLNLNEVSDVVLVDGIPHILRVVDVQALAPQTLSSVSASIRKKLAALQLKKAVKKASDDVMQQSTIEIR